MANTQLNSEKERYLKLEDDLEDKMREVDQLKGEINKLNDEKGELKSHVEILVGHAESLRE